MWHIIWWWKLYLIIWLEILLPSTHMLILFGPKGISHWVISGLEFVRIIIYLHLIDHDLYISTHVYSICILKYYYNLKLTDSLHQPSKSSLILYRVWSSSNSIQILVELQIWCKFYERNSGRICSKF